MMGPAWRPDQIKAIRAHAKRLLNEVRAGKNCSPVGIEWAKRVLKNFYPETQP